jgi:hypothetical protein
VEGEFDQRGKFGLADVPSACRRFTYELDLESPDKEKRVVELLAFMLLLRDEHAAPAGRGCAASASERPQCGSESFSLENV